MTDFRTTKKFASGSSASDGYDVYASRVDGVDNLLAADVNSLANSIAETQKALVDGYAIEKLQPAAFAMSVDNEAMVYDTATQKMIKKVMAPKDSPVFTGDINLSTNAGLESTSPSSTLNVGSSTNTSTLNLGTGSNTNTINIGTGTGLTTINIGGAGDTVSVIGTLTTINTTTIDAYDGNITVNKGGTDGSAQGAGLTVDRTGTKGSFVYDSALTSKFKLGDQASEAEVVTTSHTQTLTNKTLASPVFTGTVDLPSQIDYYVSTSAELISVLAAMPADGGSVCITDSMTLTSPLTIPPNTLVWGKGWSTVITLSSTGSITMGSRTHLRDLRIRSTRTSATLVSMPNVFSFLDKVYFDISASQTLTCASVSGTSNRILYSLFQAMTGNTGVNNTGTDTVQLYNYIAL